MSGMVRSKVIGTWTQCLVMTAVSWLGNFTFRVVTLKNARFATTNSSAATALIVIIASKTRFASSPSFASASVSARGVICQERP